MLYSQNWNQANKTANYIEQPFPRGAISREVISEGAISEGVLFLGLFSGGHFLEIVHF